MTARKLYDVGITGTPPTPRPMPMVALLDSAGAAFDATTLPAARAWRRSEMLAVEGLRRVTLRFAYDAANNTTAAYPLLMVLCCGQPRLGTGAEPLITDDVWFSPSVTDGVVTATAASGIPTSADWTAGPLFGQQIFRPLIIQPPAVVANSDKLRWQMSFDVTDEFFMYVAAQESGADAAKMGTLKIWANGT